MLFEELMIDLYLLNIAVLHFESNYMHGQTLMVELQKTNFTMYLIDEESYA